MREFGSFDGYDGGSVVINGIAWAPETYVRVHWEWIAFLITYVTLGTLFLVFTINITAVKRETILKSSALATLFALGPESRETTGGIAPLPLMAERVSGSGNDRVEARLLGNELRAERLV